jgi:hypothetical protein
MQPKVKDRRVIVDELERGVGIGGRAGKSTVKPISPSFDFKMPERRSSSSMTRRRNDSPPAWVGGYEILLYEAA